MMGRKSIIAILTILVLTITACPVFADVVPHEGDEIYYDDFYEDYSDESSWEEESQSTEDSSDTSSQITDNASDTSSNTTTGTTSRTNNTTSSQSETSSINTNSQTETSGVEEEYVVFGSIAQKENDIGSSISLIAYICIGLGIAGILAVIIWVIVGRNSKTDHDDIYQTVAEAQKQNSYTQERPRQAPRSNNPYDYGDNYGPRTQQGQQRPPVNRNPQQRPTQNSQQRAPQYRSNTNMDETQINTREEIPVQRNNRYVMEENKPVVDAPQKISAGNNNQRYYKMEENVNPIQAPQPVSGRNRGQRIMVEEDVSPISTPPQITNRPQNQRVLIEEVKTINAPAPIVNRQQNQRIMIQEQAKSISSPVPAPTRQDRPPMTRESIQKTPLNVGGAVPEIPKSRPQTQEKRVYDTDALLYEILGGIDKK